jgi:hypothetical protein
MKHEVIGGDEIAKKKNFVKKKIDVCALNNKSIMNL